MGATFLVSRFVAAEEKKKEPPPKEWIDSDTGHRVVRLSPVEGSSAKFYFHRNAFAGDKMVFAHSLSGKRRLYTVDLKTRQVQPLTDRDSKFEIVGAKSNEVFYLSGTDVLATHLDNRKTRTIGKIKPEWAAGRGFALNSDETVLAGCAALGEEDFYKKMPKSGWVSAIFEARLPNVLYTIRIKTGEVKVIRECRDWLDHVQFSPADPALLMFCHEGPWHKLDRVWTIRMDDNNPPQLVHKRTMENEIVGHEFWNSDGQIIWYDQQVPKGANFFLGGTELKTGRKIQYKLPADQWSVHYNVSHDGKLFAGDGGGPRNVAQAKDGQWIWLFTPKDGKLRAERLCKLAGNDYDAIEPNVCFTPDDKWVVFRATLHGAPAVYAVEVAKAR